jgi:AraC-like DNA-binding protein
MRKTARHLQMPSPSDLDMHGAFCFARACQLAAGAFVAPTDPLQVFASVHGAIAACPDLSELYMADVAVALVGLGAALFAWAAGRVPHVASNSLRPPARHVAATLECILSKHAQPSLSLRRIAAELRTSESHLSSTLKRVSGRGYFAHLHAVRLLRALPLLADWHESIAAIARRCGYSRPFQLNRQFRIVMNTTPSRFRRLLDARRTGCPDSRRNSR